MPAILLTRLARAPPWASACSLGAYLYLWVRGIGHALTLLGLHDNSLLAHALSEDSLRADVALLVALYGVESVVRFQVRHDLVDVFLDESHCTSAVAPSS